MIHSRMTSAAGIISQLGEVQPELKHSALENLNLIIDWSWHEIAEELLKLEELCEDESLPENTRQLASLVTSKTHYHLASYIDSMHFAITAGSVFPINTDTEYVRKITATVLDEYTRLRATGLDDNNINPYLVSMISHIFENSIRDKEFKGAIGFSLQSKRLDLFKILLDECSNQKDILAYCIRLCTNVIKERQLRDETLKIVISFKPDFPDLFHCLILLNDSDQACVELTKLLRSERLLAYQYAFDLFQDAPQNFLHDLHNRVQLSLGTGTHEENSYRTGCETVLNILNGNTPTNLYRYFLQAHSHTDLEILRETIVFCRRVPMLSTAMVMEHAFMNAGTNSAVFLREELEFTRGHTNWSIFVTLACMGVIYKGNEEYALSVIERYLPDIENADVSNENANEVLVQDVDYDQNVDVDDHDEENVLEDDHMEDVENNEELSSDEENENNEDGNESEDDEIEETENIQDDVNDGENEEIEDEDEIMNEPENIEEENMNDDIEENEDENLNDENEENEEIEDEDEIMDETENIENENLNDEIEENEDENLLDENEENEAGNDNGGESDDEDVFYSLPFTFDENEGNGSDNGDLFAGMGESDASYGYKEGGALLALGLIHANRSSQTVINTFMQHISASENSVIRHGACLGLGLTAMGLNSPDICPTLETLLFENDAVIGEAAGIALGLVKLGCLDKKAIQSLQEFAQLTEHDKILRGIAIGIPLICFGQMEKANGVINRLISDKENAFLRRAGVSSIGMAYCGTGDSKYVLKLLEIAVTDNVDDIRRAAVISLGFVLCGNPEESLSTLQLLEDCYNPHVRYAVALALGISCAGTGYLPAVKAIQQLTEDSEPFVRQGALIASALVLVQHTENITSKAKEFTEVYEKVIRNRREDRLPKFGAILAQGIINSGGRNVTITSQSRTGHVWAQGAVGLFLFTHYWHWYPLALCLPLAFAPTCIIAVNKNLKIPELNFISNCKPSLFGYPKQIDRSLVKVERKRISTAVLSLAVRQLAKRLKIDENVFRNLTGTLPSDDERQNIKDPPKIIEKTPEVQSPEPTFHMVANGSRCMKQQLKYLNWMPKSRWEPVTNDSLKMGGFVLLKDKTPEVEVQEVVQPSYDPADQEAPEETTNDLMEHQLAEIDPAILLEAIERTLDDFEENDNDDDNEDPDSDGDDEDADNDSDDEDE